MDVDVRRRVRLVVLGYPRDVRIMRFEAYWEAWKRAEPLVDLSYVSDTEVAEYRRWADTREHHNRVVRELISFAAEHSLPKCEHCGNTRNNHNPWCIVLQGGRPDD